MAAAALEKQAAADTTPALAATQVAASWVNTNDQASHVAEVSSHSPVQNDTVIAATPGKEQVGVHDQQTEQGAQDQEQDLEREEVNERKEDREELEHDQQQQEEQADQDGEQAESQEQEDKQLDTQAQDQSDEDQERGQKTEQGAQQEQQDEDHKPQEQQAAASAEQEQLAQQEHQTDAPEKQQQQQKHDAAHEPQSSVPIDANTTRMVQPLGPDEHDCELQERAADAVVLDIGSNTGWFTQLASSLGYETHAVDVQPLCLRHVLTSAAANRRSDLVHIHSTGTCAAHAHI
eukprot:scaffold4321_cov273-Prasinococcus_capsulatus_cf.AAC.2